MRHVIHHNIGIQVYVHIQLQDITKIVRTPASQAGTECVKQRAAISMLSTNASNEPCSTLFIDTVIHGVRKKDYRLWVCTVYKWIRHREDI